MQTKESLARANPNTLPDLLRSIGLGAILRAQIPQWRRRADPAASAFNLATLEALGTPLDARAATILRATSIVGTVTGELTPKLYGVTPGTGEIGVAPNGEIVVLAADAITSLDVLYVPERGDVWTAELPVASHVLTIPTPQTSRGVALLLQATATAGTAAGDKIPLVPGAGAPSAGQARLNVAKTTVTFASADAVTKARVWLLLCADLDLDAALEAEATII